MSRILLAIVSAVVVGMAAGKLQSACEERATTALCFVTVSNVDYQVEFTFGESKYWVPATNPPGVPHYDADIKVTRGFELVAMLKGQWTYRKCYEDEPTDLVLRALSVEAQRNKPGTNAIAESWLEHGKYRTRTSWVTNEWSATNGPAVLSYTNYQWVFTGTQFRAANELGPRPDPAGRGLNWDFDTGGMPTNNAGQTKNTDLWIIAGDKAVLWEDIQSVLANTNTVPMVIWIRPEAHRWLGGSAKAEDRARRILESYWFLEEVAK